MFQQDFRQCMLRPAATRQAAIQPGVTAGETLPAGYFGLIRAAPDARVLQYSMKRIIHDQAELKRRGPLVQRQAIADDADNNALDDHHLLFEIDPDRLEILIFRQ